MLLQVTPNAGFFVVNLFSFLQPYPLTLTTPPEMQPYGWTTLDLWVAPAITALYSTLTHAQPFWADVHAVALGWLGAAGASGADELVKVAPLDAETARAACAAVLGVLFATRTVKNFGGNFGAASVEKSKTKHKVKAQ